MGNQTIYFFLKPSYSMFIRLTLKHYVKDFVFFLFIGALLRIANSLDAIFKWVTINTCQIPMVLSGCVSHGHNCPCLSTRARFCLLLKLHQVE